MNTLTLKVTVSWGKLPGCQKTDGREEFGGIAVIPDPEFQQSGLNNSSMGQIIYKWPLPLV